MASGAERRWALGLAALYLVLALHGLGRPDIVGDDEAREAGIVQDVLAGHVLWPRFNGDVIPDKPTLYHWLAALACLPGGFDETCVRLPSAVAGAGLVGWTVVLGTRLADVRTGAVAGVLLATMPALLDHVRVARPDVLLALLLSLALGVAFEWWRWRRRQDAIVVLALVGATVLAKGPVGPALFVLAFGGFLVWQGDWRRVRGLVTGPGVALLLGLGLGWYALAFAGWGHELVDQHLVGRYARNLAGGLVRGEEYSRRSWLYHLTFYPKLLPAAALPWTPFVVVALWRIWRARGFADARVRLLVCWALAPVVAFTPAEWKLRYYLLPALPALALLAAPTVTALVTTPPRRGPLRIEPRAVAIAVAASGVALLAAFLVLQDPAWLSDNDREILGRVLALAPGGATGIFALLGFGVGILIATVALRSWAVLVGCVVATCLVINGAVVPALERARADSGSLRQFTAEVARRFPAPAKLAFYGEEPIRQVIVYLGRPVPVIQRGRDVTFPVDGVITDEATWRRLVTQGRLGPPLAVGRGRVRNLGTTTVVLAEPLPPPGLTAEGP